MKYIINFLVPVEKATIKESSWWKIWEKPEIVYINEYSKCSIELEFDSIVKTVLVNKIAKKVLTGIYGNEVKGYTIKQAL